MAKKNIELLLDTGKKVVLRSIRIRDSQAAAQAAVGRGGDNQFAFSMQMQNEMLKMLLVSIDGKVLSAVEKENLDELLELDEYTAIMSELQALMGNAKVQSRSFID